MWSYLLPLYNEAPIASTFNPNETFKALKLSNLEISYLYEQMHDHTEIYVTLRADGEKLSYKYSFADEVLISQGQWHGDVWKFVTDFFATEITKFLFDRFPLSASKKSVHEVLQQAMLEIVHPKLKLEIAPWQTTKSNFYIEPKGSAYRMSNHAKSLLKDQPNRYIICHLPGCKETGLLWFMIQHFNDRHKLTKLEIADWMQETGNDVELKDV